MPLEPAKEGLKLRGHPLFLDAHRKVAVSFVSHAHGDHIARHRRVIASEATAALMQHRLGKLLEVIALPFGVVHREGELTLELFPAGHILGAAQVRITRPDGHRLVYTGDLSLEPSLTCADAQVAPCDTLILEATFGQPRYCFPPRGAVFDEIATWAREALGRGEQPIVFGYALGKAQEAVAQLEARGLPTCVHPDIDALDHVYRAHGVTLGARRFDGHFLPGEVGVFPPWGRSQALRGVPRKVTAVLTGWAMDPGVERRYGAQRAFPISDHADFPALLRYAKATGAREVLTHHGFARELADALLGEGLVARPVDDVHQLELGLGGS